MFHIPAWISNVLLLITFVLSGWQHSQLKRSNPITNIQFATMVGAILMMLVVTLYRPDPWLSVVFFLIAAGCLLSTVWQQRSMPPNKRFE